MKRLEEIFEKIYELSHQQKLREMAYLGSIEHGKQYVIFIYSREYLYETPHINLGNFSGSKVHAKIEIPLEEPNSIDDFEVLPFNKRKNNKLKFEVSNNLKKKILDWYKEIDKETGLKNWKWALASWNKATETKRIGQI